MASTAAGIRAGKAFVEIGTQDSGLMKGLRAAQEKVTQFGKAVSDMGTTLAAASAAMLAPIGLAVKQFIDFGSQLDDTAKKTGFTVETLSELKFAGDQSGSSLEDIEKAAKKMASTLVDAKNGSDSAADSLAQLGLSAGMLLQISPEDQFLTIADALSQVEDASLKSALAQDIFGRAGTNLLPMLAEGSEGLKALREEAKKVGATMSKEDAAAAETLGDALGSLTAAAGSAFRQIGAELAPALQEMAATITTMLPHVRQFISDNGEWLTTAASLAVAIGAVGVSLKATGAAIALVTATNPWVLMAGAIAVVTAEIIKMRAEASNFTQGEIDFWKKLSPGNAGLIQFVMGGDRANVAAKSEERTTKWEAEKAKASEELAKALNGEAGLTDSIEKTVDALNANIDGYDFHTEAMAANLEAAKKVRAAMDAEEQQRLAAMEQEARLYDIEAAGLDAQIEHIEALRADAQALDDGRRGGGLATLGSAEFAQAMAEALAADQSKQDDTLRQQLEEAKAARKALDEIVKQNKNAPRLAAAGV